MSLDSGFIFCVVYRELNYATIRLKCEGFLFLSLPHTFDKQCQKNN